MTTVEWTIEDGVLSLATPGVGSLAMHELSGSVWIDTRLLALSEARDVSWHEDRGPEGKRGGRAEFVFDNPGLRWTWNLAEQDGPRGRVLAVTARLRNTGARPLIVGDWNVLHARRDRGGAIELGTDPANVRFFRWQGWNSRVQRLGTAESRLRSNNFCHLYDPAAGVTLLCGFVTLDRMLVHHELHYVPDACAAEYRAVCSPGGYVLPSGGDLISERLVLAYHDDPYAALEDWADEVYRIYRPTFKETSPVGWDGGAWIDTFSDREDNWETVVLENARALREKLRGFDVSFIWTSQKNLKDGLPGHWLTGNEQQVPGGMPALLEKLESMGFSHKLWFSPFWFFAEARETFEENRENRLKDRDGKVIMEPANWEFDLYSDPDDAPRLTKVYLDGTHPRTREYLRRVFAAYRDMGVRSYMLDFLAIKPNARPYDETLLPVQAVRAILEVIRDAAGEDARLQTAVASTPGYVGLIEEARIGRDFGEGRPLFPPYNAWRNATYVVHDEHFGNTFAFVQNAALNYFTHRKVYVNDLNVLTIDKPVPLEHARIAVTMFGLSGGSPMTLGDDFRRISPERLRMIKLTMPRTREVPVPVDLFERVHPDDYCRILKLPVATEWDSWLLVAVFNFDADAFSTMLDFAKLGLDADAAYRVFDFWNEEYVGTFKGWCSCVVPPDACRLYRLAKMRTHPWLLSTDMHVQQGRLEITSLDWDNASMTLSGTAVRPAGEAGNLFILMPRRWKLINHKGAFLMKDVRDMNVVVRLPLRFTEGKQRFSLHFQRMTTPYVSRKGWLPYATEDEFLEYWERHRRLGDSQDGRRR